MYVCVYPTWIKAGPIHHSFVQVIEWLGVMGWLRRAEASDDEKRLGFTVERAMELMSFSSLLIFIDQFGNVGMAQNLVLSRLAYLGYICIYTHMYMYK